MVQNVDQRYFTESTEITPLMAASSLIDSNVDLDSNDETRKVGNFEDGDFPALRPNYDRRAHAHHGITKILAIEFSELAFQRCIMKLGKLLLFSGESRAVNKISVCKKTCDRVCLIIF